MSQVFEGYERQYCELSANLSRKCNSAGLLPDGEEKMQKISEIKTGVDEADVLIRKMDLEARSLQPSLKAVLLAKLREYKADLNKVKREVKKISSNDANQVREELLKSGIADAHVISVDQRERLAMSIERLNQSSDRIKESRRTTLETEELGVSSFKICIINVKLSCIPIRSFMELTMPGKNFFAGIVEEEDSEV